MREEDPNDQLSRLSLSIEIGAAGVDWPEVSIEVDGRHPFAAVAREWRGFDPAEMLGADAPLVPSKDRRHVALYRCSCGIAGCGVIAARIERSSDGRRISWSDFRNYIGVFDRPLTDVDYDSTVGRSWPLTVLHFDAGQYEGEVRRVAADRSWATRRRRTARLVEEQLADQGILVAAPELHLQWVAPALDAQGVMLSFFRRGQGDTWAEEVLLHIISNRGEPDEAAGEIVHRLAAVDPRDWQRRFEWRSSLD